MTNACVANGAGLAMAKKRKWKPINYLCLAIALVPVASFIAFNAFPVVISFVAMFADMDSNMLDTMRWNNFENFKNVLTTTSSGLRGAIPLFWVPHRF